MPTEAELGPGNRLEQARRAAAEGARRLAASVAAVCGPRGRVALGAGAGEPTARTAPEVEAAFPRLEGPEEAGARPLREAARRVREQCGRGVGDAVCLTGALLLEALRALARGSAPGAVLGELREAYPRLVPALTELSRPAQPDELEAILSGGTGGDPPTPAPGSSPHQGGEAAAMLLLVPGRRRGLERLEVRGALARVAPQGAGQLHQAGLREGPHRVLRVCGPVRTGEEVRRLLRALGSFEEPLVVLADRLSPSAATDAADLVHRGQVHGHLVWWAPGGDAGDLALRRMVPEAENVLEASGLDPASLPLAQEVVWCRDGVLLALPESRHALGYTVLLEGPERAGCPELRRAVSLVEATRLAGMVPGGGAAYVTLARWLGEGEGSAAVRRALEAPLRVLVENEGMDAESVLDRIRGLAPGSGFDVLEGRYFGPREPGPMTPSPVVAAVLSAAFEAVQAFLAREGGASDDVEGT